MPEIRDLDLIAVSFEDGDGLDGVVIVFNVLPEPIKFYWSGRDEAAHYLHDLASKLEEDTE